MKVIHMIVNGTPVELAVREDECLTDTLRQRLGLTSVKKGCGVGECGACTVLLDGKATNSCIYLTLWADGREIITVEGLRAKNGCLHPVQQAFVDEAAVQCGFCIVVVHVINPCAIKVIASLGVIGVRVARADNAQWLGLLEPVWVSLQQELH